MTQDQPKLRRCPKCRSAAIVLVEIATVGIRFEQTVSGRWRRNEYGVIDPQPFMVQGECQDCSHEWRVPGWPNMQVKTVALDFIMSPTGMIDYSLAELDCLNDPTVPTKKDSQ